MKIDYKWIGLFALLLWMNISQVNAQERENTIGYRVTRNDYTFSTVFDMATDKYPIGSIIKSSFHIATHYDMYDRFGLYEGQGICRLASLGLVYTWATEIDIYNVEGDKIGMIDGQIRTTEPAKFSFYDSFDQCVAIAYLDKNCLGFSLVDPNNSSFVLARLTRNFIQDTIDNWDIMIYYPELLPPKLVKIFAAFVCDTQNKFKPDL